MEWLRVTANVREFMVHTKQYIWSGGTTVPNDVRMLRYRLVAEEWAELVIAVHLGNIRLIADAMADLLYVIAGTAITYGVPYNPVAATVENTPKLLDTDREEVYLIMLDRMADQLGFLGQALRNGDRSILSISLGVLATNVHRMAFAAGIPLDEVFERVHISNMTKSADPDPGNHYGGVKIGKPESFRPPQLDDILIRVGLLPGEPDVVLQGTPEPAA